MEEWTPQLPDIEVVKSYLDATSLHQEVDHIQLHSNRILRAESPQQLGRSVHGKPFFASSRHAKYLFIQYDHAGWLVLHFGMTGRLAYFRRDRGTPDYSQLLFHFSNGFALAYVSPRKLGYVTTTSDPRQFIDEHKVGEDALELTEKTLKPNPLDCPLTICCPIEKRGRIVRNARHHWPPPRQPAGPVGTARNIRNGELRTL